MFNSVMKLVRWCYVLKNACLSQDARKRGGGGSAII